MAFAWHVPWEQVRRERLLRLETSRPVNPEWLSGLHRPHQWRQAFDRAAELAEIERRAPTVRRFARLEAALRLYGLEHRTPAPDLAALVPSYLSAVPVDPFTGRPLGYRLSTGETIAAGSPLVPGKTLSASGAVASLANPVGGLNGLWVIGWSTRRAGPAGRAIRPPVTLYQWVPAGYAILWSAGPDGRNDGGRRSGPRGRPPSPGDDWVVLVRPHRGRERALGAAPARSPGE